MCEKLVLFMIRKKNTKEKNQAFIYSLIRFYLFRVILIFVDIENPRDPKVIQIDENEHGLYPDLLPNLKMKRYLSKFFQLFLF